MTLQHVKIFSFYKYWLNLPGIDFLYRMIKLSPIIFIKKIVGEKQIPKIKTELGYGGDVRAAIDILIVGWGLY